MRVSSIHDARSSQRRGERGLVGSGKASVGRVASSCNCQLKVGCPCREKAFLAPRFFKVVAKMNYSARRSVLSISQKSHLNRAFDPTCIESMNGNLACDHYVYNDLFRRLKCLDSTSYQWTCCQFVCQNMLLVINIDELYIVIDRNIY